MKTYSVELWDTIRTTIEVKAENEEIAVEKATKLWNECDGQNLNWHRDHDTDFSIDFEAYEIK